MTIIKFKNNSVYVQRKINTIFRIYKTFVRIYVDNIVIFNKTFKKHLSHLYQIFQLLNSYKIRLLSKKLYLNYSIIVLLNQKIDAFNLIIVVDKLIAIVKFQFFFILKNLKIYFDFID